MRRNRRTAGRPRPTRPMASKAMLPGSGTIFVPLKFKAAVIVAEMPLKLVTIETGMPMATL